MTLIRVEVIGKNASGPPLYSQKAGSAPAAHSVRGSARVYERQTKSLSMFRFTVYSPPASPQPVPAMASQIKAVFFDIGGVVVHSPIVAIHQYEQEAGLPKDYLNVQITAGGKGGAWQRFERGEISNVYDFYNAFGRELSDTTLGNPRYLEYLKKNGKGPMDLPDKAHVDGRELFGRMMRESTAYDDTVVQAILRIRASSSLKIIALTNNFTQPYNSILAGPSPSSPPQSRFNPQTELTFLNWSNGLHPPSLKALFDDFVDSSEVGMRKPEPEFYLLACKRNEVEPREVVFLDDLRMNLKAASALGMRTIHVPIGGSTGAIRELEKVLGLSLLGSTPKL